MGEEINNEQLTAQQNQEQPATTQTTTTQNNTQQGVNVKINNGLRIANIILLCIVLAAEVFALIYYIPAVQALFAKDLSALAILGVLPIYFLITCGILVVSIVMSIIAKSWKKYLLRMQQSPNFLDKLMGFIGWIFVVLNVLGFLALYII